MTHLDNTWKLEDAKAQFSELVRRAQSVGPQTVTVRGKEAVVIVAARQMTDASEGQPSLTDFLRGSALGLVDVGREDDLGREFDL